MPIDNRKEARQQRRRSQRKIDRLAGKATRGLVNEVNLRRAEGRNKRANNYLAGKEQRPRDPMRDVNQFGKGQTSENTSIDQYDFGKKYNMKDVKYLKSQGYSNDQIAKDMAARDERVGGHQGRYLKRTGNLAMVARKGQDEGLRAIAKRRAQARKDKRAEERREMNRGNGGQNSIAEKNLVNEYDTSRFEESPEQNLPKYRPSNREYTQDISLDREEGAARYAQLDRQNQEYKSTVGANNAQASLERAQNTRANTEAILGNRDPLRGASIANSYKENARNNRLFDIEAMDRDLRRRPIVGRSRAILQGLNTYGDQYRFAREMLPEWKSLDSLNPIDKPDLGGISDDYLDKIDELSI